MKTLLRISICLNLAFLGSLAFLLAKPPQQPAVSVPAVAESSPPPAAVLSTGSPAPATIPPEPFRWSQLESRESYRIYIANLRAAGCPEPTIDAIVRNDTARAFAWERQHLKLDGSGDGPWSRWRETQLIASLLQGGTADSVGASIDGIYSDGLDGTSSDKKITSMASQIAVAGNTSKQNSAPLSHEAYPLFLQSVNWSALGFNVTEQTAIAQVRDQYKNEINGNQTSASAATPGTDNLPAAKRRQIALQNADDQLRGLLGAQGYSAYMEQQYYAWFQPQVMANASGGNLNINPKTF